MRRWQRITVGLVVVTTAATLSSFGVVARQRAHELLTNPRETRHMPGRTPGDYGLPFDDVTVRTSDGLWLAGWYIPSSNRAAILLLHGYKADRGEMLNEAAMLHRHGYGVLVSALRTHDRSDGTLITFGIQEMKDLDAWVSWLARRPDVDPERLGAIGNSMGGSIVIRYAADHPAIKAIVANSAFSSLAETIETSIRFFTGLPPFPFAPMITFWAERKAGFQISDVDFKPAIARLSPRPVFLMQGGQDVVISPESGKRLFDAARDPKELWFDREIRHTKFDTAHPEEYERRVVAFFDRALAPQLPSLDTAR